MVPHIYNIAKVTATGSAITLGSTLTSCYFALEVEKAAHRVQFKMFPHWYANVQHANGIDPDMLATVRAAAKELEEQMNKQQLAIQQEQDSKQQSEQAEEQEKLSTKTSFTIENIVRPVRESVERRTRDAPLGLDLGGCAMTA